VEGDLRVCRHAAGTVRGVGGSPAPMKSFAASANGTPRWVGTFLGPTHRFNLTGCRTRVHLRRPHNDLRLVIPGPVSHDVLG